MCRVVENDDCAAHVFVAKWCCWNDDRLWQEASLVTNLNPSWSGGCRIWNATITAIRWPSVRPCPGRKSGSVVADSTIRVQRGVGETDTKAGHTWCGQRYRIVRTMWIRREHFDFRWMCRIDVVQLQVDIALSGCIQNAEAVRLAVNWHRWECCSVDCHDIHEGLRHCTWVWNTRHHRRLARSTIVWVWLCADLARERWPEPLPPVVAPHTICTGNVIWVLIWHVDVWVPKVTHRAPVPGRVSCSQLSSIRNKCLVSDHQWDSVAVFIIRCRQDLL